MDGHSAAAEYVGERLERLLTISDVGRLLGVSRGRVYGFVEEGELIPIRVGARARFEPDDVRAFLDRHREKRIPEGNP